MVRRAVLLVGGGGDEVGEGIEPESSIESTRFEECSIDEVVEDFVGGALGIAELGTLAFETGQGDIASLTA